MLLSVSLSGLAGCAFFPVKGTPVYWPDPPDPPRFVYEATLHSLDDIQAAEQSLLEKQAKGAVGSQQLLNKPFDVAAHGGVVAITDTQSAQIHVYDLPRKRVFSFGWRGDGQLQKPLGVAMDDEYRIYVADGGQGVIAVYTRLGHFLGNVGGPALFERLADVAVSRDGSRIYALDRGSVDSERHQVTMFNAKGEKLGVFGGRGRETGKFNHPAQLSVGSNGNVWVLDAGNFRVQQFDAQGKFLTAWGAPGRLLGQLARPRGLAVDAENRVYISDAAFQNVQIFNQQGQLLLTIGAKRQYGPGHYALPAGMDVDETGRLYVVDQFLNKVEVLRLLSDAERAQLAH